MLWGRSPTGKAGSPVSAPPTGPPFTTTGSFSTKDRSTKGGKGSDENRPIAHTPPNPSPPEPGARSTALLLNRWNEITEGSGVQHDAARGQLTIASNAPFAHHDRTGSLRWIRSAGRWAHRGVSLSAVGRRRPGSRSGEVAGKAPGIVQVLDQRFAHEHARRQAASRKPRAASREPGALA